MSWMKLGERLKAISDGHKDLFEREGPHPRERALLQSQEQQQQLQQQQQANANGEKAPARPEARAIGPAQQSLDLDT